MILIHSGVCLRIGILKPVNDKDVYLKHRLKGKDISYDEK